MANRVQVIAYLAPMNRVRSWREQKVMLKWRFPFLSDEDFAFSEDHREAMLTQLAVKLNKTRTELENLFAEMQRF